MLYVGAHIFVYFVVPLLGAVLMFVLNPAKVRLRWRLLGLLICSLWVAPFIAVALLVGGEGNIDWRVELPRTFLVGPLYLLWLAGLGAIGFFLRAAYRWVRQRLSRAGQPGS